MKRPIIGILIKSGVNERNTPLQYVFESTRRAIINVGGEPLLLCPPQNIDYFLTKNKDFPTLTSREKESINYWLDQIDGLFLPGGSKITKYDFYILNCCLKRNIPVLGVCLGMQTIANYNIDNFVLEEIKDPKIHFEEDPKKLIHKVIINTNSILYKILDKNEIVVNSFHKRCVSSTKECNIVGRSSDGVIEAVELKNYDFCLGVQWHPEITLEQDVDSFKILDYFIKKATLYKKSRKTQKVKED